MTDSIFIVTDGDNWRSSLAHHTREDAERMRDPGNIVVEYIPAGWRSMETAPKDGQVVLLRRQGDACSLPHYHLAFWKDRGNYGFWMDTDDQRSISVTVDGWFPIPK